MRVLPQIEKDFDLVDFSIYIGTSANGDSATLYGSTAIDFPPKSSMNHKND